MCLILNKNKNKTNGNHTLNFSSLDSFDVLPGTPESGAPEEGGNLNNIFLRVYIYNL